MTLRELIKKTESQGTQVDIASRIKVATDDVISQYIDTNKVKFNKLIKSVYGGRELSASVEFGMEDLNTTVLTQSLIDEILIMMCIDKEYFRALSHNFEKLLSEDGDVFLDGNTWYEKVNKEGILRNYTDNRTVTPAESTQTRTETPRVSQSVSQEDRQCAYDTNTEYTPKTRTTKTINAPTGTNTSEVKTEVDTAGTDNLTHTDTSKTGQDDEKYNGFVPVRDGLQSIIDKIIDDEKNLRLHGMINDYLSRVCSYFMVDVW